MPKSLKAQAVWARMTQFGLEYAHRDLIHLYGVMVFFRSVGIKKVFLRNMSRNGMPMMIL